MSTRQEIQMGHDLIMFTDRLNTSSWCTHCTLQFVNSIVGDPLRIRKEVGNRVVVVEPTVDDVKEEVGNSVIVSKKYERWLDGFLSKMDERVVNTSVSVYDNNVHKPLLRHDLDLAKNLRMAVEVNIGSLHSKQELVDFGKTCSYMPQLYVNMNAIHRPPVVRLINIANDVLDALSYELQGYDSYEGNPQQGSFENLIKLAFSRLEVAGVELNAASGYLATTIPAVFGIDKQALVTDIDIMQRVIIYVRSNLLDCNSITDLNSLGQYIDSNVNKLPLVRRHWAI